MQISDHVALKFYTSSAIEHAKRIMRRMDAGEANLARLEMEWLLHDITRCQEVVLDAEHSYHENESAKIRARIAAASGRS